MLFLLVVLLDQFLEPDGSFCNAASTTGCLPSIILNFLEVSNFGRHQFSDTAMSASATARSISARAFAASKMFSENSRIFIFVCSNISNSSDNALPPAFKIFVSISDSSKDY